MRFPTRRWSTERLVEAGPDELEEELGDDACKGRQQISQR